MPVLTLFATGGVFPSFLNPSNHTNKQIVALVGLILSFIGLIISTLWLSMVSRSRKFFAYRINCAYKAENLFPVSKDKVQLFRNKLYDHSATVVLPNYEHNEFKFSLLEQIKMGKSMKTICWIFILLHISLCILNSLRIIWAW